MKILHIIGGKLEGGAGRGAFGLHEQLLANGVDSQIWRATRSDNLLKKIIQLFYSKIDNFFLIFHKKKYKNLSFSTGFLGRNLLKTKEYKEADIIHLHWINGGELSLKQISKIKKPIVWTLRDMWPFTGGCHYSIDCEKYKTGCNQCPQLSSSRIQDLSYVISQLKKTSYKKNITPVAISSWMQECAQNSSLMEAYDVKLIFNGIDTEKFFPLSKEQSRQLFNLPQNKTIILVGAQYNTTPYKGFDFILKAIPLLKTIPNLFFVFFGSLDTNLIDKLNINYKYIGILKSDEKLQSLYSASDVFLAPSIQEAFGKTLTEAMACGTPVVCFDATGPKDIVDHKINGFKAQPFSVEDLVNGVRWVLENNNNMEIINKKAREKVVTYFSIQKIVLEYCRLYSNILKK